MARFNSFYENIDLEALRRLCLERGTPRRYGRGDLFLRAGEVCDRIGLVTKGYFRYSVLAADGSRHVVGMVFHDEFVADFSNSLHGVPAMVDIEAARPGEVMEVTVEMFRELSATEAPGLEASIMHTIFGEIYRRFIDQYRLSATERYKAMVEAHPELLQDVPLRDIASYLRVTPIHLSRIRRSLLKG